MTFQPPGGTPRRAPAISPSLLRLSALQRLAIAGVMIALIWSAYFWSVG